MEKDLRPKMCRFRLRDEGKPYPKSGCEACHATLATLGRACGELEPKPAPEPKPQPASRPQEVAQYDGLNPPQHVLKTVEQVWYAIQSGKKTFDIRRNDRFFQTGDIVILRRIVKIKPKENEGEYFRVEQDEYGRPFDLKFKIGWMMQTEDVGLARGYCAFQLEPV